jgi:murein DD-endopeptidase MepM/ murein hydrolase activator NlpD
MIADIFSVDNYNKLKTFLTSFYESMLIFFQDPLGFILSVIWGNFVNYACWAVAYALGSIETQLPPIPSWGINDSGSGGDGIIIVPPGSGVLVRPVSPLYVSGYVYGSSHHGTDFGITMGQSVYAAHDGIISGSGWSTVGYGNKIDINGNPYWSRYGHLQQILVSNDQEVKAGQLIAYGDSTGNSTGAHLHFELKINGSYVNPVLYL